MLSLKKTVRRHNHLLKAAAFLALLLSLAALMITTTTGGASAQGQGRQPAEKFLKSQGANAIPDHYIVVLKDDIPGPDVDSIAAELAQSHGGVMDHVYRYALKVFSIRLPEAAAMALSHDPARRICGRGRRSPYLDDAVQCAVGARPHRSKETPAQQHVYVR